MKGTLIKTLCFFVVVIALFCLRKLVVFLSNSVV